jgi:penicillin-binding protein 1A
MKIFNLLKYIFLLLVLGISILIIFIWNIQEELPDSNISDYFPNEITKIYDENYDLLYHVGTRDRFYLEYSDIPLNMVNAIIAAEDKTFFVHQGFDMKGIANAFIINIRNIFKKSDINYVGASTITQQLVKNILLNNDQTISRKLKELILSIRIERSYTKKFILELYLNEIYFGRRSYGIASAAHNYFNKSIFDLELNEFAYLAALPKGPNNYDPKKNYKRALDRRNYVLKQMLLNNFITSEEFDNESNKKIIVSDRDNTKYQLDYKTDYILESINQYSSHPSNAYYIQSTINQDIQKIAEKSLIDNLFLLEKKYQSWKGSYEDFSDIEKSDLNKNWVIAKVSKLKKDHTEVIIIDSNEIINLSHFDNLFGPKKQNPKNFLKVNDFIFLTKINDQYFLAQEPTINGSVLVMDPFNGDILAMVGGVSYLNSKFNRSTQAFRQPGSSIKPFIYAQAIEQNKYLPNSIILDSDIILDQGPNLPTWIPKNYSNKSYGTMTFRRALETSNNLVTLKIGLDLGLPSVNSFFNKMNLYENNKSNDVYSLLLGAIENNLLNITKSYSLFVNGGYEVSPNIIKKVVSDSGQLIANQDYYECKFCQFNIEDRSYRKPIIKPNILNSITPQTSFQILNILRGAVERGTGKSLNEIDYPLAGKTGTTNDSKDLWFFGLTPKFVVGVYVGYDKPKKIGYKETGSSVALPVFKSFMKEYLLTNKDLERDAFFIPKNLILKKIDIDSGLFSDKDDSIFEFFTKDQLETINNLNKVDNIGGIN